jgi:flagellar M-ring protein FliF
MKNTLASLRSSWDALGVGARFGIALGTAAAALLAVVAARWTSEPDFEVLYTGLDAREIGAVQSALASADVRYRVSQPPGPFIVHVDGKQYYAAQNAVALAGALDRAPEGIGGMAGGASQVFMSAQERAQASLKREWQELEKQLEELQFVERARVSTSIPDKSPLRKPEPMTVAVTLTLRGRGDLTQAQSNSVARLARFRFNVPAQNVLVTDQNGRSLVEDGTASGELAMAQEMFEQGRRGDAELERKANDALKHVFGTEIARVVVTSSWSQEEIESVKETVDPRNKVVVSETSSKSSTPSSVSAGPSGFAGTASSLLDGPGAGGGSDATVANSTTSESTKSTAIGRETQLRRSHTPRLDRLSVSLFLDASLKSSQAEVEAAVKSAVGFDAARGDSFASMTAPFVGVERDAEGNLVPRVETPVEAPSRIVEMLMERGVEIAVAGALLFLLFRALRGAKNATKAADARPDNVDEERWIEMLARSRVEDLVKTDPERLGEILSRWADDGQGTREKRVPQGASR